MILIKIFITFEWFVDSLISSNMRSFFCIFKDTFLNDFSLRFETWEYFKKNYESKLRVRKNRHRTLRKEQKLLWLFYIKTTDNFIGSIAINFRIRPEIIQYPFPDMSSSQWFSFPQNLYRFVRTLQSE